MRCINRCAIYAQPNKSLYFHPFEYLNFHPNSIREPLFTCVFNSNKYRRFGLVWFGLVRFDSIRYEWIRNVWKLNLTGPKMAQTFLGKTTNGEVIIILPFILIVTVIDTFARAYFGLNSLIELILRNHSCISARFWFFSVAIIGQRQEIHWLCSLHIMMRQPFPRLLSLRIFKTSSRDLMYSPELKYFKRVFCSKPQTRKDYAGEEEKRIRRNTFELVPYLWFA